MGHCDELVAEWFKHKTGKEIRRSVIGKSVRASFHELDISPIEMKLNRRVLVLYGLCSIKGSSPYFGGKQPLLILRC